MNQLTSNNLISQLHLMIRAGYPILYIVTIEEEPLDQVLNKVASLFNSEHQRSIKTWDISRGWSDDGTDKGSVIGSLIRVGRTIQNRASSATIFVLRDIHPIFKFPYQERHVPIIRELRNLAKDLKKSTHTLIITSNIAVIPDELKEEITVIDFPLPNYQEINNVLSTEIADPKQIKLVGLGKEQFIRACQGLSRARIKRVLACALAENQQVTDADIDRVIEEKKQAIRQTGILEFLTSKESLKNVGGLENLKQWVRMRQKAFTDEARKFGIPNPKGVLLVGIQGTGKSLSAKTIAHEWRLPLLRLDTGRLFGGIVGESESRIRQMIQLVEAIAPCVLWIDEIDKAFGNISSGIDSDSGTSRRVFGTLITWMQEKSTPVFIVATANNVSILPAELLRKGRFDEIFFLNLPTETERRDIFKVHLQRLRGHRLRDFDLGILARQTTNFSGSEIEQVIIDGLHRALGHSPARDLMTEDILRAIEETVPLASIARSQIEELKRWAAEAGARTASNDDHLLEEIRKYRYGKSFGNDD